MGQEPTPEDVVQVREQCEVLMDELDDDMLRTVAQQKLEGYTNGEIAKRLDVVERTVERKLERIRAVWTNKIETEDRI